MLSTLLVRYLISLQVSSVLLQIYVLGKVGYVFGSVARFVCLFVCLSVCGQHYSKSDERIGRKFYGGILGSTMKN